MLGLLADFIGHHARPALIARIYRATSPALSERVSIDRFRRTVRWAAARSPFYRRAFAEHGIDPHAVRHPADLGGFFTTPEDIASNPEDFLCERPNLVFESSGTSGQNKRVFYSRREWGRIGRTTAGGLRLMGITSGDRVANAFDFSIWIPGLLCH